MKKYYHEFYTKGFVIIGALIMLLGIRASSSLYAMDADNVILTIIGLVLILIAGIFWISAAINWKKPKRKSTY